MRSPQLAVALLMVFAPSVVRAAPGVAVGDRVRLQWGRGPLTQASVVETSDEGLVVATEDKGRRPAGLPETIAGAALGSVLIGVPLMFLNSCAFDPDCEHSPGIGIGPESAMALGAAIGGTLVALSSKHHWAEVPLHPAGKRLSLSVALRGVGAAFTVRF